MDKVGGDHKSARQGILVFRGRADFSKAFHVIKQDGLWAAIKAVGSTVRGRHIVWSDRAFDRRYGTDTYAIALPEDLTIEGVIRRRPISTCRPM